MIFPFLHWFVYPRSSDGSSRIVLIRMLFGKELYRREFVVKEIAQEEILEECGYNVELENIEKITEFYSSVGFAGSKQTLFFATIDEKCKVHQGGGVDDENIEVIFIPRKQAYEFILDESYPKTSGIMFAFLWFLKERNEA